MMLVPVAKFFKTLITDVLIIQSGGRYGYTFYFRPSAGRFYFLVMF
jgi:hypothetical protein